MRNPQVSALALAALYTLWAPVAAQSAEHEHVVSLRAAWARGVDHGVDVGATWSYGFDDFWNLAVDADWAGLPGDGPDFVHRAALRAGVLYHLDAFEWVPWVQVSLAGYGAFTSDVDPVWAFGLFAGGGLDYRPARDWSIGLWGGADIPIASDLVTVGMAGLRGSLYFD